MDKEKTLTTKQQLFIVEYLKDFNATRAARDAGYSKDSAEMIGWENLRKPYIQKKIQDSIDEALDIGKMTLKKEILDQLRNIAFDDGEIDVKEDREGNILSVSRKDKIKALELLGKYMALFTDKIEIGVDDEAYRKLKDLYN